MTSEFFGKIKTNTREGKERLTIVDFINYQTFEMDVKLFSKEIVSV